jgi:hypothetical protein
MNLSSHAQALRAFARQGMRLACLGLALAGGAATLSGCNKDTGTTVTQDPAKVRQDAQRRIQEVQNDPRIPPQQKQAIIGRLQATAQGGGGEAEARNRISKQNSDKK